MSQYCRNVQTPITAAPIGPRVLGIAVHRTRRARVMSLVVRVAAFAATIERRLVIWVQGESTSDALHQVRICDEEAAEGYGVRLSTSDGFGGNGRRISGCGDERSMELGAKQLRNIQGAGVQIIRQADLTITSFDGSNTKRLSCPGKSVTSLSRLNQLWIETTLRLVG
jgi:hypothetical protein